MTKQIIETKDAPAPIGPYSQATIAGGFIFTAGQAGLESQTGKLVAGGIAKQTAQTLRNLQAVLEASGSGLDHVLKANVFLADLNDFAVMNEVYGGFFTEKPPARTTVQAARLPLDALVEIELVAVVR